MTTSLLIVMALTSCTALCFCGNLWAFRRWPPRRPAVPLPGVSVLVPARNEAATITALIDSVLAATDVAEGQGMEWQARGAARSSADTLLPRHVEFELLVLDDHSDDETGTIVAQISRRDPRVRLVTGQPLPGGWCGKQFACAQLAEQARYDYLLFIDADVRLAPGALPRMLHRFEHARVDLLSGFPRQVVGTLGEGLLVPWIHVILLCYLPFFFMRRSRSSAFAAGCGQLFITTPQAYQASGGHAAIRGSLHDGLTLPRAYRRAGLVTDLFDAAPVARCRMYDGGRSAIEGVLKNAHEGIARWPNIGLFSVLILGTFVAPWWLFVSAWLFGVEASLLAASAGVVAVSYLPRLMCAWYYDRDWLSASLLPISALLFITLQWMALIRRRRGTPSTWRGRSYPAAA